LKDLVAGNSRRKPNVLLDVSSVDKRKVNCLGNVGGGHHHDILELLQLINLREESIDDAYGVRRLIPRQCTLARSRQALDLINQDHDKALWVIDQLLDRRKQLIDKLAALAEPLAEERMCIHLPFKKGEIDEFGASPAHLSLPFPQFETPPSSFKDNGEQSVGHSECQQMTTRMKDGSAWARTSTSWPKR
jgi:hypothetical protein